MTDHRRTEKLIAEHVHGSTSLFARLRGYFLAGILVTAPITLTIYITLITLNFVDRQVASVLPAEFYNNLYGEGGIPGLGLMMAVAFFIVIGWFASIFLGRYIVRLSEYVMNRMPIIRTIYGAIKQIFETVMSTQSETFREAVLVEFPRKGIWAIGFLTGKTEGEIQRLTEDEVLNVFVPTTPNPTSGFLVFVPKQDVYFLNMSVEEGIKMIVSAGILTPKEKPAADKTAPAITPHA